MSKSPDAFRTIREVADWLGVAAHVLRFWESKFSQVRPVKRAGGRRYYRPADMELLGGIKVLLHDRGMTVRGVQRLIREEGVAHVAALSPSLDTLDIAPELVEGIAEEEAWHADARAEEATAGTAADPPPARDPGVAGPEAEAAPVAPGPEEASDAPVPEADSDAPVPEADSDAPVPGEASDTPIPEDALDAPIPEAAPDAAILAGAPDAEPPAVAAPGSGTDTPALPGFAPETKSSAAPSGGDALERLAVVAASTDRTRIAPRAAALRALQARMAAPVGPPPA